MKDQALEIKMFGTFTMEYQGRMIGVEGNERTRTNQLLQILICARNGITREQLWRDLFGYENVADPANSLRGLLHRLRKCLKEQGIPGEKYVSIDKRIYSFTPDCPVECDVYRFEDILQKSEDFESREQRLQLLEEAALLYGGEFLSGIGATEWSTVLKVKYKKMYVSCIEALMEGYKKRKEYEKMYEIAGRAASIYPYDNWRSYQMEALIAMERTKEAIRLYEDTDRLLFNELGIAVPQSMVDMMSDLRQQVRNKTNLMSEVLTQLNEGQHIQGPYECTYLSFRKNYHMISRMIERTGQSAWLILYTITDGKGYAMEEGERGSELRQELYLSIQKTLRKGDIFTRYSKNQYLLLLLELNQEGCRKVAERIAGNLNHTRRKKYFTYHIAPVMGVKG